MIEVVEFYPSLLDKGVVLTDLNEFLNSGYQIIGQYQNPEDETKNGISVGFILWKKDNGGSTVNLSSSNFKAAEIIQMEAARTKNSGSPMWRCFTQDGTKVNIFKHSDPEKNAAYLLFEKAGYAPEMLALQDGQSIHWTIHPIQVQLAKVDGWWTIEGVTPRDVLAMPDPKIPNTEPF